MGFTTSNWVLSSKIHLLLILTRQSFLLYKLWRALNTDPHDVCWLFFAIFAFLFCRLFNFSLLFFYLLQFCWFYSLCRKYFTLFRTRSEQLVKTHMYLMDKLQLNGLCFVRWKIANQAHQSGSRDRSLSLSSQKRTSPSISGMWCLKIFRHVVLTVAVDD